MFNCEQHDKHKEPFTIRIYMDDLIIFQYIMQGRDVGNIPWLERKANAVKRHRMSSIEAFYVANEGKFPGLKMIQRLLYMVEVIHYIKMEKSFLYVFQEWHMKMMQS